MLSHELQRSFSFKSNVTRHYHLIQVAEKSRFTENPKTP